MNQVYTHPGQSQMQVEVILASQLGSDEWIATQEPPILYTIRMRYPRPIHGEIMTHRDFSRNARSSRAVPVRTMLLETTSIPFIPWHWGKNQKGMQASEECNETVVWRTPAGGVWRESSRESAWLEARDKAVEIASLMMDAGYHKQNVNRLLEPFAWIDTLITATNWNNFIHLRDHKDAEPHLQDLARLVKQAIDEADIRILDKGQWHLPYITREDIIWAENQVETVDGLESVNELLCQISAARCARISYKPFDGDASYEAELRRYNDLVTSERVHASPLEHQAKPDTLMMLTCLEIHPEHLDALDKHAEIAISAKIVKEDVLLDWKNKHQHGNLRGFIQHRKLVEGEYVDG